MSGTGTLHSIFTWLITIAVPLAAFATGLRSTEPAWLWKRPRLLLRSLLAILVVVPIVEVFLANVLSPTNAVVRAGIVVSILAVGIGPPALLQQTKAPKDVVCYEIGLNISLMVLAIVYLPLAVAIHGEVFHHELSLPWSPVAKLVLLKAILPFAVGAACARWLPKVAAPLERHAPKFVGVCLLVVVLLALMATWRSLIGLGPGAWLICAAIAMVAILIGHLAGGPAPETRAVLASFSAIRFPALALLLTTIVPRGRELIPVVIAYVVTSALMVAVYRAATRHAAEEVEARP